MKFIFFGTPKLSVIVLEELKAQDLLPSLVITAPDKPSGRGMKIKSSPVKLWAVENDIPTIEPEEYTDDVIADIREIGAEVFVLVAYGKILPKSVIDLSPNGILNVHPSLLPKLRGPSPVRSAILEDHKETGVTIMLIDEKMDHGPILIQEKYAPEVWPPNARELDEFLFARGGSMLADALPKYLSGDLVSVEQDHSKATYCKLFEKEDGLIDLKDDAYENLLKIHAYQGWPGTYFFVGDVRVNIISAHIENGLVIDEVIPEGKSKMSYQDFISKNEERS